MNRKILWVLACVPLLMAAKCDPGAEIACPSAKNYSRQFLSEVDKELDVIADKAPHVMQMLADYDVTLRAIRSCIKKRE
jgi:hypothetical protein